MVPRLRHPDPTLISARSAPVADNINSWRAHANAEDFVVESWSEGFIVGALIIMACITVANMRKGILLHKLILSEACNPVTFGAKGPDFCRLAIAGHDARHVLLHGVSGIRLVPIVDGRVAV